MKTFKVIFVADQNDPINFDRFALVGASSRQDAADMVQSLLDGNRTDGNDPVVMFVLDA